MWLWMNMIDPPRNSPFPANTHGAAMGSHIMPPLGAIKPNQITGALHCPVGRAVPDNAILA